MQTDWHALEFTKTRGWEPRDRTTDDLASYGGLVTWCERRGFLQAVEARRYRALADQRPSGAHSALRDAHGLRHLIYSVLRQAGSGRKATVEQLEQLTAWTRKAVAVRHLIAHRGGVRWRWRFDPQRPDNLLAPIAWSMAELMVAPEYGRIRLCDGDDCGWLFVDGSRAGTRRWCDMSDCGNLHKVRRFRARRLPAR